MVGCTADFNNVAIMPENADFTFEHRVFSAPGACFRLNQTRTEVNFSVDLGGVRAIVPLSSLVATFEIDPDSNDARLLDMMERSLRFVREIRPGDSVPSELLDGTSSWHVAEQHLEQARSRLTALLEQTVGGGKPSAEPGGKPALPRPGDATFEAAAQVLGLEDGGGGKVAAMLETLAREYSYILALRDHLTPVLNLPRSLHVLQGHYRRERAILETLLRVQQLTDRPVSELRRGLERASARLADMLAALRDLDATIAALRDERDRLREHNTIWEEVRPAWSDSTLDRSERTERLVKATYRFVVANFPLEQRWALEL